MRFLPKMHLTPGQDGFSRLLDPEWSIQILWAPAAVYKVSLRPVFLIVYRRFFAPEERSKVEF